MTIETHRPQMVAGEPHGVTFVEYLRVAIGWGGFPGWKRAGAAVPAELEPLWRDLFAF